MYGVLGKPVGMDVITLTGNLLAEWTFEIDALKQGATHRATEMSFQVGGKGFNVSRILNRLGSRTQSVGFAEGPLADFCSQWAESRQMKTRFFPLAEGVRPGLVVRESGAEKTETTFLGQDLKVPSPSWKSACQHIEQSRPDWLAICGSVPGWQASWHRSIELIMESPAGIRICADTYGPPLRDLANLPLELVKINRSELNRLYPDNEKLSTQELLAHARKASPVRNWIITDGPRSISVSLENGTNLEITPARINEVSPTGSGDTFLAALLHGWPAKDDFTEALTFATACSSANAASAGIGDFPLPVPERFQPTIREA